MKKLKLVLSCLILFATGSSFTMADETPVPGVRAPRLGVEGGFNLASLNGPTANDVFASRLGFVGGGFLNLPLGPSLAFQVELLYAQKGGKFNGSPYQLDYVEIPLLFDVTVIGPVDIILGVAFDANVAKAGAVNVNQTDVGLVLGTQLSFSKFIVSGRYEVGLTDVRSDQQIQNGTFTLMAGLSFI
jgi:hypothetical protein